MIWVSNTLAMRNNEAKAFAVPLVIASEMLVILRLCVEVSIEQRQKA